MKAQLEYPSAQLPRFAAPQQRSLAASEDRRLHRADRLVDAHAHEDHVDVYVDVDAHEDEDLYEDLYEDDDHDRDWVARAVLRPDGSWRPTS